MWSEQEGEWGGTFVACGAAPSVPPAAPVSRHLSQALPCPPFPFNFCGLFLPQTFRYQRWTFTSHSFIGFSNLYSRRSRLICVFLFQISAN